MNSLHRVLCILKLVQLLLTSAPLGPEAFKLTGSTETHSGHPVSRHTFRVYVRPGTLERVTGILSTKFEKEEKSIELDCNYRKEFGADNLDEVELLLALEEEFDINIPDHDFNDLYTVKDIAEYLDRRLGRKKAD